MLQNLLKFCRNFPIFSLLQPAGESVLRIVRLAPDGSEKEESFRFRADQTVLEVALQNRIRIATSCGGMGTCGTCRVELLEAPAGFEGRNEIECEMASERGFRENERLACQLTTCPGLRVGVPETSIEDDHSK